MSRSSRKLHAFASAEHPESPLREYTWVWKSLLKGPGPTPIAEWRCGDHGGETYAEAIVSRDRKGIHVSHESYDCSGPNDSKGKLLERRKPD